MKVSAVRSYSARPLEGSFVVSLPPAYPRASRSRPSACRSGASRR